MSTKTTQTKKVKSDVPVPFQDRIIISKVEPEKKTAGGLYIPELAIKEENKGIVVAVGPAVGRTLATSLISSKKEGHWFPQIGDVVLFGEYAGIPIPDTPYMIVKEADVLAKL